MRHSAQSSCTGTFAVSPLELRSVLWESSTFVMRHASSTEATRGFATKQGGSVTKIWVRCLTIKVCLDSSIARGGRESEVFGAIAVMWCALRFSPLPGPHHLWNYGEFSSPAVPLLLTKIGLSTFHYVDYLAFDLSGLILSTATNKRM
jgi:hypothetical protein